MHQTGTRDYLRGALWVYPTVSVVVALIIGAGLTAIKVPSDSWVQRLLFQGTADDARTLLIGISGTMMTVIALVLGLTLVALQLSSTQYSPRLLRHFLRDRVNQYVLSTFVATFVYATAGLYTVGIKRGQRVDDYPRLAVTLAILLLFASLLVLIYFVHHVSHSIQVDEVMAGVERRTMGVIHDDLPTVDVSRDPMPVRPRDAVAVPAYRSGYVQTIHTARLYRAACDHDAVCSVVPMVGEHVVAEAPLVWVWHESGGEPVLAEEFASAVHDSVRVGYERTSEQDVALGVRQLADIAVKALSPAINDPYTSIQALEHLSVLLAELARAPLGNRLRHEPGTAVAGGSGAGGGAGSGERLRVAVPGRDLEYFVELATGQVRRYGAAEPRVMRALLRVLGATGAFCQEYVDREVIARHVRLVLEAAELKIVQVADREPVLEHGRRVLAELTDVLFSAGPGLQSGVRRTPPSGGRSWFSKYWRRTDRGAPPEETAK